MEEWKLNSITRLTIFLWTFFKQSLEPWSSSSSIFTAEKKTGKLFNILVSWGFGPLTRRGSGKAQPLQTLVSQPQGTMAHDRETGDSRVAVCECANCRFPAPFYGRKETSCQEKIIFSDFPKEESHVASKCTLVASQAQPWIDTICQSTLFVKQEFTWCMLLLLGDHEIGNVQLMTIICTPPFVWFLFLFKHKTHAQWLFNIRESLCCVGGSFVFCRCV